MVSCSIPACHGEQCELTHPPTRTMKSNWLGDKMCDKKTVINGSREPFVLSTSQKRDVKRRLEIPERSNFDDNVFPQVGLSPPSYTPIAEKQRACLNAV